MSGLATAVRERYLGDHPAAAAKVMEERLPQRPPSLEGISTDSLCRLFEHTSPALLTILFLGLDKKQQTDVLQSTSIRVILQLLDALDPEQREGLFNRLPDLLAGELKKIQSFPPGSAGNYMDRFTNLFHTDQTVGEALEALRGTDIASARSIHLMDPEGRLVGRVDMQDMALAEPETRMADLLHPISAIAKVTSTESDLVKEFERFRTDSIPVVDEEGKLLGVVRYASLFEAASTAATANIQRMAGVSAEEKALSSASFAVKRRVLWLHINLLTAFLAASVVGLFESTIAQFTALAVLLPVVAGQSGNAGSQALAVTMRGLALKEISTLQWPRVVRKELMAGFVNGAVLAITCGLGVWVWSSFGYALVIAIAMISSMVVAGMAGALVPITLQRVGQDPATASSIILTTVTDVAGFMAFLGTATALSFLL